MPAPVQYGIKIVWGIPALIKPVLDASGNRVHVVEFHFCQRKAGEATYEVVEDGKVISRRNVLEDKGDHWSVERKLSQRGGAAGSSQGGAA